MEFITELFQYMTRNWDLLLDLAIEHLIMVLIGVGMALVVGVTLGIICARFKKVAGVILSIANIIQIIPSLALLAILMVYFGLGFYTVVVGLFLYSLMPIIRNTYVGLKEVDKSISEAGRGLGMTSMQLLSKVQLPLALPFLMAGLRVAAVIAVGVAALAPMIGGDGLGREIFAGINTMNDIRIYAGAIPAALLAIFADVILGFFEKYTKRKTSPAT
ncbi:ABC transporter permease [Geomicrobium sp. JCM 19039]|uniref:ABC transporter permease n=1 Tax=Geomicrobium sp. JCM 19039 TaxID=1460636 RepID=UPI00045F2EF4|nr:ABC transporter permease [Geomicrobium sp. JCM 19039]GAK14643.1 osmotically activated L-carnitine/choline ABC transporter, permease protein OpuCD [Geomicrobium sp. JCM 19039]